VIEAKPNKNLSQNHLQRTRRQTNTKTEEVPEPAVPLDSTEKEFDASVSQVTEPSPILLDEFSGIFAKKTEP